MWKDSRYFIRVEELINREFYEYYKEHRTENSPAINQYNYFVKAIKGIIRIINAKIKTDDEGVYLKGLGYFCFLEGKERQKKRRSVFDKKKRYNLPYLYFYPEDSLKDIYIYSTQRTSEDIEYKPNILAVKMYHDILGIKTDLTCV